MNNLIKYVSLNTNAVIHCRIDSCDNPHEEAYEEKETKGKVQLKIEKHC